MGMTRTFILLAALTAVFLVIGQLLGGRGGLVMAAGFALVMNFGAYWFSDKIVLKLYKAREVDANTAPEFYRIVEALAKQANIPMPKTYIIPTDAPNAFATGRNPQHAAVAATEGILKLLNNEELTGVMAHEISHVINHDTLISTISATLAGAIGMLANMAQMAMIFGNRQQQQGNALASILMMILAPIAAALIQFAVSRTREYAADKSGAQLCGHPQWLASALQKLEQGNIQHPMPASEQHPTSAHLFIVNPLTTSKVANLFSTHPPLEERVRRLMSMENQTK
jgi:heat shock protein HtpX